MFLGDSPYIHSLDKLMVHILHILDKKSNRPLTCIDFLPNQSSVYMPIKQICQSTLPLKGLKEFLALYPGCADTPIFKIHKIQHFVTICENFIFKISIFHEQNHFVTMAYD